MDSSKTLPFSKELYLNMLIPYKILALIFLSLFHVGCVSVHESLDFSKMTKSEIEAEATCLISMQCKSLPYSYDGCGNAPESASSYLVYSTLMGKKNVEDLKSFVIEDRERIKKRMEGQLIECLLLMHPKPKLACSKSICKRLDVY